MENITKYITVQQKALKKIERMVLQKHEVENVWCCIPRRWCADAVKWHEQNVLGYQWPGSNFGTRRLDVGRNLTSES